MAADRRRITVNTIQEAEARYSDLRFRSLGDEWVVDFPDLLTFASTLKRRARSFAAMDITDEDLTKLCVDAIDKEPVGLSRMARMVFENKLSLEEFRTGLIKVFYKVGLVGVRAGKSTGISWSFQLREQLREAEITDAVRLEICPMFYRVLGTPMRSAT